LNGLIDWMIEKNLRLWQAIMDYLQRKHVPENRDGLIGDVGGSFDYNRGALLESVARTALQIVATYDRAVEARVLSEDIRAAIVRTGLVQALGVGIGGLILAATTIAWVDVTGILAASLISAAGLFVLPAKRRQLKKAFHDRIVDMRQQLLQTMQRQFST